MQDRKIESLNFLVVAYATLKEDALVLKHVGLTGLALAKAIKDRFGNRVRTIIDRVDAAVSFANDSVVKRIVAKTQTRMGFQDFTTLDRGQGATHWIRQALVS